MLPSFKVEISFWRLGSGGAEKFLWRSHSFLLGSSGWRLFVIKDHEAGWSMPCVHSPLGRVVSV